jgi:hypothetical protein
VVGALHGREGVEAVSVSASDLIDYAQSFTGVPYVWGGTTPAGFDCSGFVKYVFEHFGVNLPRTSREQVNVGTPVDAASIQPGDLIFSNWNGSARSASATDHVALYLGGGNLIQAPQPGENVGVKPFNASYQSHVTGIRRVTDVAGGGADGAGLNDLAGAAGDFASQGVLGGIGKLAETFAGFAKMTLWFANPANDIRVLMGIFGLAFLGGGLWMLGREVRRG